MPPKKMPTKSSVLQKRKRIVPNEASSSSSDGASVSAKRSIPPKAPPKATMKQTAKCSGRGRRSLIKGKCGPPDRSRSHHRRENSSPDSSESEKDVRPKAKSKATAAGFDAAANRELADVIKLMQNPALNALAALLVNCRDKEEPRNSFRNSEAATRDFDDATDVDEWIKHFLRESDGISHVQKMQLFRMKTSAKCFAWYNATEADIEDSEAWTVHDWLRRLQKDFKPTSVQLRNAITSRVQKEGEDAGIFIKDMVALCKRYQPQMSVEDMIAYIEAAIDGRYKGMFQVFNLHVTSIQKTESSLRGAMKYFENRNSAIDAASDVKPGLDRSSVSQIFSAGSVIDAFDVTGAVKARTNATVPSKAWESESMAGTKARTMTPASIWQRSESHANGTEVICQLCEKRGHSAKFCWLRNEDLRHQSQQRSQERRQPSEKDAVATEPEQY